MTDQTTTLNTRQLPQPSPHCAHFVAEPVLTKANVNTIGAFTAANARRLLESRRMPRSADVLLSGGWSQWAAAAYWAEMALGDLGQARSIKEAVPLRHSRLTWQLRSPWCRLIRRAPSPPFTLARRPGSAVHSPLRDSCLKKKSSPKGNKTLS